MWYNPTTTNLSYFTLYLRLPTLPLPTPLLLLLPPLNNTLPRLLPTNQLAPLKPSLRPLLIPKCIFAPLPQPRLLAQMFLILLLLRRVAESRELLEPRKLVEIREIEPVSASNNNYFSDDPLYMDIDYSLNT